MYVDAFLQVLSINKPDSELYYIRCNMDPSKSNSQTPIQSYQTNIHCVDHIQLISNLIRQLRLQKTKQKTYRWNKRPEGFVFN